MPNKSVWKFGDPNKKFWDFGNLEISYAILVTEMPLDRNTLH